MVDSQNPDEIKSTFTSAGALSNIYLVWYNKFLKKPQLSYKSASSNIINFKWFKFKNFKNCIIFPEVPSIIYVSLFVSFKINSYAVYFKSKLFY